MLQEASITLFYIKHLITIQIRIHTPALEMHPEKVRKRHCPLKYLTPLLHLLCQHSLKKLLKFYLLRLLSPNSRRMVYLFVSRLFLTVAPRIISFLSSYPRG